MPGTRSHRSPAPPARYSYVYERAAFVLYLAEIFCLAPTNWDGYADLRSFTEVYLLAVLILFAAPRRLWWYAACAAPLFVTVASYRPQIR